MVPFLQKVPFELNLGANRYPKGSILCVQQLKEKQDKVTRVVPGMGLKPCRDFGHWCDTQQTVRNQTNSKAT